MKNIKFYTNRFVNLRVSRSDGVAPNKPILLLSVIEMIGLGLLHNNEIPLSGELIATFLNLWSYLEPIRKPNIGLPFYHLITDGFWHYKMKSGFESLLTAKVQVRSPQAIRQTVEYAYLDSELWGLLQNAEHRSTLTHVLIKSWFADKSQVIEKLLQVNVFGELEEELRSQGGKVYDPEELKDEETFIVEQKSIVRDTAFRKIVVSTYNYSCAFCGVQVLDSVGQNIVDGSHIMPFSQFYDDRINNGISLCKNHHWAFDRFWFTIDDDYKIIVDRKLQEKSPNAKPIQEYRGDTIILPNQSQYYPRLDAIEWHRQEFLKRTA
ncbi:HNH endonuclease [Trichormus variabilis]|uniref:HNH endonuclease n=1 Tax=Trichormus variabilis SAG 1403-4b TaxID=447716 RepID=A0A3S1AIF9_ANAVA|nr:HNH endonuclease [Trichormus variabilis]MBD2629644.1 HNH endonuclease [Trichormus variabilis FACHB-164]RUS92939.1 HNH endonuclease [Trichormus variabilis SAG 1403-4b]